VEQLGRELDAIRAEIEESRGAADAAYINRLIKVQRGLATAARVVLATTPHSRRTRLPGAVAGAALLGAAKILENMEIGHNVMHGQWDWMNDPEIHSSNWEWDTAQPAEQWKHSHNYVHHQFTNVLGYDNDIGYGILRMAREQKWSPYNLGQPVYNSLLAFLFEWGVALHDLDIERIRKGEKDPKEMKRQLKQIFRKGRNQILKDYVVYPALAGRQWKTVLAANATSNVIRNLWSYVIIFCGHFPDGAMHFTEEEIEDESRSEWYLRQILGAANFQGGPLLHIMSGNLGFQIEHHLYPDLPSNRYAEISEKVKELCAKYDLPYTTGPLHRQYGQALRTIIKLSVPNSWTKSDQPEPPTPPKDRKRRTDDERPHRRRELGGWSRAGAAARA
jgi:NADPH-dependent stearoyl-CoA 9-desaturase